MRVLNVRGLRPLRFRIRIRLCTQIRIMSGSIELPIANTMTSQHKSGVTASVSALAEMRGGARQQHSRSDGPNRVVHRQFDLPPNFGHRRASARGSFPPSPSPSTLFFIRRQQLPRTILRSRPPSHFRIVMCIIHIYTIKLRSSSEEPTQLVGYLPRSTSLRPKQNLNHRKLLRGGSCGFAGSKWQRITAVEIQNSDTAVYSDTDHVRKHRSSLIL